MILFVLNIYSWMLFGSAWVQNLGFVLYRGRFWPQALERCQSCQLRLDMVYACERKTLWIIPVFPRENDNFGSFWNIRCNISPVSEKPNLGLVGAPRPRYPRPIGKFWRKSWRSQIGAVITGLVYGKPTGNDFYLKFQGCSNPS